VASLRRTVEVFQLYINGFRRHKRSKVHGVADDDRSPVDSLLDIVASRLAVGFNDDTVEHEQLQVRRQLLLRRDSHVPLRPSTVIGPTGAALSVR
jgi:hypothetical protein